MIVLDIAEETFEVALVLACSLVVSAFEGCILDIRRAVFAPVLGRRLPVLCKLVSSSLFVPLKPNVPQTLRQRALLIEYVESHNSYQDLTRFGPWVAPTNHL